MYNDTWFSTNNSRCYNSRSRYRLHSKPCHELIETLTKEYEHRVKCVAVDFCLSSGKARASTEQSNAKVIVLDNVFRLDELKFQFFLHQIKNREEVKNREIRKIPDLSILFNRAVTGGWVVHMLGF